MKISFSGAHGTGKTTSVFTECTIHKQNSNKEIGVLTEIARKCPFPINKEADEDSQLWIFTTQLKEEIELSKLYDIVIINYQENPVRLRRGWIGKIFSKNTWQILNMVVYCICRWEVDDEHSNKHSIT